MDFQFNEDLKSNSQYGGFIPYKISVKGIILTWYLLISFGHGHYVGPKMEDETNASTTNATVDLIDLRTDHGDVKRPQTISFSRGINLLNCFKRCFCDNFRTLHRSADSRGRRHITSYHVNHNSPGCPGYRYTKRYLDYLAVSAGFLAESTEKKCINGN